MPDAEAPSAPLILLVDDFDDNREMFAEFLEISGYRVAQAATGREALRKSFDLLPAVIVMDLSLPEVDGREATRILKNDARTQRIPIIALTGHSLTDRAIEGMGCDGFLMKPCMPDTLLVEIRRALARL